VRHAFGGVEVNFRIRENLAAAGFRQVAGADDQVILAVAQRIALSGSSCGARSMKILAVTPA